MNQLERATGNNRHAEIYMKSVTIGAIANKYKDLNWYVLYVPLLDKMAIKEVCFNNNKYFKSPIFSVDHPKQDTDNGPLYIVGNKSVANYTGRGQFYKIISFMNNRFKLQAFMKIV